MLKKLLFVLTDSEKRWLVGLIVGSAILALSETVSIGLIIPIMSLFMSDGTVQANSFMGTLQALTGARDRNAFLTVLIIATMAVFLFKSCYSILMLRLQYSFTCGIYCRLTGKVMASYLYGPYSFHLENNSSVLVKNMITEVSQFTSCFLSPAILIASEAMIAVSLLLLLVCVYPAVTLLFIGMFSAILLVLNFFVNRRVKAYSKERERYSEAIYVTANEALGGVKEIQINGAQGYFIDRFSRATKKYQRSFLNFNVLTNLPRSILETVVFFAMLAALLVSLHLRRPPAELIPVMTVMAAASIKLLPSLNKIYLNFNTVHYFANSLDIVYSILNAAGQLPVHAGRMTGEARAAGIDRTRALAFSMKDVTFSYKENGPAVLDAMSLDFPFSRSTAIVGASGAGKTTLIDVLTGLLRPASGSLYFAGQEVRAENIPDMRERIGYVPQHIFLIDDTIGANIAFGIPVEKVDRALVRKAARMANLDSFVAGLPKGLDTTVGERGARLSGGQRQRIGIARALYRNPDVLILDEATSALDGGSEAEVVGAIDRMKAAGMAVIIVAHRPGTIAHADMLYVIARGKVAAKGTFKDLCDGSEVFNAIIHKKTNTKEGAADDRPQEKITRYYL